MDAALIYSNCDFAGAVVIMALQLAGGGLMIGTALVGELLDCRTLYASLGLLSPAP